MDTGSGSHCITDIVGLTHENTHVDRFIRLHGYSERDVRRFVAKIEQVGECWIWRGKLNGNGYGAASFGGDNWLAHRLAYELFVGPIPDGLTIDHLCRVRACVRAPLHLEPVTLKENILRSDGACALKARQAHCKNGHPLSGDNLRPNRRSRDCVLCHREYNRASYHKLKAGAA